MKAGFPRPLMERSARRRAFFPPSPSLPLPNSAFCFAFCLPLPLGPTHIPLGHFPHVPSLPYNVPSCSRLRPRFAAIKHTDYRMLRRTRIVQKTRAPTTHAHGDGRCSGFFTHHASRFTPPRPGASRLPLSTFCFAFDVVSGQWSVVSGQSLPL